MLCQATMEILTSNIGIPFFHALAIEAVIKRIHLFEMNKVMFILDNTKSYYDYYWKGELYA
jgi:hypothetical protein